MSNVVFILGAGCSKECGAPLMADFLDIASNLYSTNKVGDKAKHFESVFKAIGSLQAVHSKAQLDLNNIESVFNALEMANALEKLPGFQTAEIPGVIASLKEVIVKTLEETIKFPTRQSFIGVPEPYESFARLIKYICTDAYPIRTVSVITFNYDVAIDMALFRAGLGPDYGFDASSSSGYVPLLKLHGSLNWALKPDEKIVIPLTMGKYFQKYSYQGREDVGKCSIPIGNQLQECFLKFNIKVEHEPVIVPPTWNKAEYHETISQVWSRAAKELGESEYIFIIGYSLPQTDAFFRLLYALGTVGDLPLKKIEVFNPDKGEEIRNRFEYLMGPGAKARFNYHSNVFSQAIGIIWQYFPSQQY